MPIFNKESLENLRQRVDLVEVLSSHIELKRSGASYKGLCPFHDEKSPSFIVQKGDSHYHCFGCGAHGDAIQFLMSHQKLSFAESVESLAQRFQVHLELVEDREEKKGVTKAFLKLALETASQFFHYCLLYSEEGHEALNYLYNRGIDLDFICHFQVGLAPKTAGIFRKFMHAKGIKDDSLLEAGLLSMNKDGQVREFFNDRILFPIHHHSQGVIGFSGRKYKEETFGGKYINTPETSLFKKSRVLFGLNYSRRRIAKERKAIIVEGQIDALRLIQMGFNLTVAGQGTAFGEGHVQELINLGVNQVFLALDSDLAGQEATSKIGHLFQKEGIEVRIVQLPVGGDPDSFLREQGPEAFLELLKNSSDYLNFLIKHLSQDLNLDSPAAKNELVQKATKLIREWDHPLMVHETLRKLAHLMKVPEEIIGVGKNHLPNIYIKKSASVGAQTIDPDRILETDLLRWLLLLGQEQTKLVEIVRTNLVKEDFRVAICQKIYDIYRNNYENQRSCDLLSLAIDLDDAEGQLVLSDLLQKKVNKEKAEQLLIETVKKILDRNWMHKREEIKIKVQSGHCSDDEVMELIKQFDELKRNPPIVK
ncbi:DNA primase [Candidatus Protochlamydia amoebophila]|uniref:DNA primase n=1 Tax=Candidatus Protochlamydia amoebophila TaxID=362787 RepID=UPI001BC9F9CB|nr:DNA primase [Candidatus Protochlamydia amoebophila]MBS4163982.1 DNA primase [Candidatus Protochlamydia amoebophila]